ncbi:hypothetical protein SFUMM280S_10893 [Streptomyces fumanus]
MVPVGGSRSLAPPCPRGEGKNQDHARTRTAAESDPGRGEWSGAGRSAAGQAPRKDTPRPDAAAPHGGENTAAEHTNLTVLLIEDDPGGSVIVPDLLDQAGRPIRVRTARNLTEAERLLTDDVHCILLDLALSAPGRAGDEDDDELAVLKRVLDLAPRHAVLALTASTDAERGAEAVAVGAQDYLFRDELDGRLLSRAIRYAVERKRSDSAERRLAEGRLRAQENRRLERGLLPTPLLEGSPLRFAARYRPGRSRALLGGDFYDVVRTPDGTVHAMIGDVCGHGPDEAALGVELRIAWRALTLAGLCGDQLLGTLQEVLEHERAHEEIFATLCTVDIAPTDAGPVSAWPVTRRRWSPRPACRRGCCRTTTTVRRSGRCGGPLAPDAGGAGRGVEPDALHRRPDRGARRRGAGAAGRGRHAGAGAGQAGRGAARGGAAAGHGRRGAAAQRG